MEASHDAIYVEIYCCLAGFFALTSHEQRALVPAVTAPVYASFKGGDDSHTRPLEILLGALDDAQSYVATHHGESDYSFVPKNLHDALSHAVRGIDSKWYHDGDFFDTAMLDAPEWDALRIAARDVWNALDETHRLPFGDWRDYAG